MNKNLSQQVKQVQTEKSELESVCRYFYHRGYGLADCL